MNRFLGTLDVRLVEDSPEGKWELLSPFGYMSTLMGVQVTAEPGFQTEFCSVPRIPIVYWSLGNCARRAGVIHDWLYRHKTLPRQQCDYLLREMVLLCGCNEIAAYHFYSAVRMFGAQFYGSSLRS